MKIDATDPANRAAAYHEAGHIVIACALGLPVGLEGIRINSFANGQAWFWGSTDGVAVSPSQVDAVVTALFAGGIVHQRIGSFWQGAVAGDEWRINDLLNTLHPDIDMRQEEYKRLKARTEELVGEHWTTIANVADALWDLPWVSKNAHSELPKEKILNGSELVEILAPLAVVIDANME